MSNEVAKSRETSNESHEMSDKSCELTYSALKKLKLIRIYMYIVGAKNDGEINSSHMTG